MMDHRALAAVKVAVQVNGTALEDAYDDDVTQIATAAVEAVLDNFVKVDGVVMSIRQARTAVKHRRRGG